MNASARLSTQRRGCPRFAAIALGVAGHARAPTVVRPGALVALTQLGPRPPLRRQCPRSGSPGTASDCHRRGDNDPP